MSVSITGKLNKAASEFAAGDSVGFGLRVGQQHYDRETKQKEWTNYEFAVFAKAPAQIEFYRQALVEGAVIEVLGKRQKIKQFNGNNGLMLSIEILDASLESVNTGQAVQAQPQGQSGFGQPPQAKPKPQSFGSFAADPWSEYKASPTTNGATIEQVKVKYSGDLGAAIANGHVVSVNDFDDDIPF